MALNRVANLTRECNPVSSWYKFMIMMCLDNSWMLIDYQNFIKTLFVGNYTYVIYVIMIHVTMGYLRI